jgi:hypothetical protein
MDYRISRGVRIAVRPAKHFGEDLAAQTAGGFSIDIGVLIDAQGAGINIAKQFKKLISTPNNAHQTWRLCLRLLSWQP